MKKKLNPQKVEMSPSDLRETYEMLRAAHTLLRMAFGAVAMFNSSIDEKEAKAVSGAFDKCFHVIGETAAALLSQAQKKDEKAN